ncbi:hypothetical protein VNO80_02473 [Phaseolus coccineus]|uniref:Uncharacterized protein n=1 Tax=Phaseolus coccineus TaxID=3886 RepID=A0AAN9NUB4_PHACN
MLYIKLFLFIQCFHLLNIASSYVIMMIINPLLSFIQSQESKHLKRKKIIHINAAAFRLKVRKMKTISGHCGSVKDGSLSKAAKILSKFVSADNGASHIISAYLCQASDSFSELNQIHKELESSHSHKKHKKHRTETGTDSERVGENCVGSVDINQKLPLGLVKSVELRRQQSGNENADLDDEKLNLTIVKCNQELNGSVGTENVGGSEMHKKKKRKKLEVGHNTRNVV